MSTTDSPAKVRYLSQSGNLTRDLAARWLGTDPADNEAPI